MKTTSMTLMNAYNLLHEGSLVFADIETHGIRVDLEYVDRKQQELDKLITKETKQLQTTKLYRHWKHSIGGKEPNIYSDTQLRVYLFRIRKLRTENKTNKGLESVDKQTLLEFDLPELNTIIHLRELRKLRTTYLQNFVKEQVDGFIKPIFNLHLVVTYRGSSDSPNFQNIPKRNEEAFDMIRNALFPRKGNQLMEVDFSGIEVSIAACYHQDPVMLEYLTTPGKDMHGDMAAQIFCIEGFDRNCEKHGYLRSAAKNGFVFPQFYGDYYKNNAIGLCRWAELPLRDKWKQTEGVLINDNCSVAANFKRHGIKGFSDFVNHMQKIEHDFWNNRFKVYGAWKLQRIREYQKTGEFRSLTGFKYSWEMRKNQVVNYPVQGSAFHCLLWSLIRVHKILKKRNYQTRIIGQIHDSIVLDVYPPELEAVSKLVKKTTTKALQQEWDWIILPLKVDAELGRVDGSWASLEKYKLP